MAILLNNIYIKQYGYLIFVHINCTQRSMFFVRKAPRHLTPHGMYADFAMTQVSNLEVRGVSLLWLALGISCTLNAYGFSFATCQFFGSSTVVWWAFYNADLYVTVLCGRGRGILSLSLSLSRWGPLLTSDGVR